MDCRIVDCRKQDCGGDGSKWILLLLLLDLLLDLVWGI